MKIYDHVISFPSSLLGPLAEACESAGGGRDLEFQQLLIGTLILPHLEVVVPLLLPSRANPSSALPLFFSPFLPFFIPSFPKQKSHHTEHTVL